MSTIRLTNLVKQYPDGTPAVRGVDFEIGDGQMLVLLGPSGCGKTTLLRMVAGLETVTQGEIWLGDRLINNVPPKRRDVAMVFQNYALYPHMSVFDNMAFGLKLRKFAKADIQTRVREAAEILGLTENLNKKPAQLSGGQRQRVAMGRAIVRAPQVFLMDEPLSNLDAKLRVQMRTEVTRIQRTLGVTTIYVTHDQVEAMTMGDRVAVMNTGLVEQLAEPQELYEHPANLFVAGFLGAPAMNFVDTVLERDSDHLTVNFAGVQIPVTDAPNDLAGLLGQPVILGVRPEDIVDANRLLPGSAHVRFPAHVEIREVVGSEVYLHFPVAHARAMSHADEQVDAHGEAIARVDAHVTAAEGSQVQLAVDPTRLHFFEPSSGNAIGRRAPSR